MTRQNDNKVDAEGVLAGASLPTVRRFKAETIRTSGLDEVSLQLARLKTLHPQLSVHFRTEDLGEMTVGERQLLLQDCYEVLGVKPRAQND